jgi:hypothetical protein
MPANHNRIKTQSHAASELPAGQGAIVAEWRKHKKMLTGLYYRVSFGLLVFFGNLKKK